MKYEEVEGCYGGPTAIAQVLGLDNKKRQMVWAWKHRKRIPWQWQIRLAYLSGGRLKPDSKARREAADMAPYVRRRGL